MGNVRKLMQLTQGHAGGKWNGIWTLAVWCQVCALCPTHTYWALSMCSALFHIVGPISPPPHEVGSTFRSTLPGLRLFEARWFSAFRSFQIFRRQFNSCTRCNKILQQSLGQHFIINVTISTKQDRNWLEVDSWQWKSGFVTSGVRKKLCDFLNFWDSEIVGNGLWTYVRILIL